jgi:TetR/AcrR family transcriptional regulator of autoinduction and epiphytic fitness
MSKSRKIAILAAARSVFLRYGYKRVSMNDISEAAGTSRSALYLDFKSKEEIFIAVVCDWVDETVAQIEREIAQSATPAAQLDVAFELWAVRPFEMTIASPEVKELVECSFDFAQPAMRRGYRRFEAVIAPVLAAQAEQTAATVTMDPERMAHVLTSAVQGFKHAATSPAELRLLIADLLALSVASTPSKSKGRSRTVTRSR